jgi:hypothetical protein
MVLHYWYLSPMGEELAGWAIFKHEAHAEEFIEAHPELTDYTFTTLKQQDYNTILNVLNNPSCLPSSNS